MRYEPLRMARRRAIRARSTELAAEQLDEGARRAGRLRRLFGAAHLLGGRLDNPRGEAVEVHNLRAQIAALAVMPRAAMRVYEPEQVATCGYIYEFLKLSIIILKNLIKPYDFRNG